MSRKCILSPKRCLLCEVLPIHLSVPGRNSHLIICIPKVWRKALVLGAWQSWIQKISLSLNKVHFSHVTWSLWALIVSLVKWNSYLFHKMVVKISKIVYIRCLAGMWHLESLSAWQLLAPVVSSVSACLARPWVSWEEQWGFLRMIISVTTSIALHSAQKIFV